MVLMNRIFYISMIVLSAALHTSAAQAQWVQTNGPYGASVTSIISFGNNIFIGTEGGVFESTDQGSSWQSRSSGLPGGRYYYTLTTHGTNIFAATYSTVYCSTDSGATWSLVSAGMPDSIFISSLGSSKLSVFVLSGPYSYVSSNDGNEWRLLDTNLTKFSNPQVALTVDSTTYVAGGWITETTNDGLNWEIMAIPPDDTSWDITCLANLGDYIYAIDRKSGILLSTDRGATWENIIYLPQFQLATNLVILGTEIFAGSDMGSVFCSNDSGKSWKLASSGLPIGDALSALSSSGTELLAGYDGSGMFRSFDSGKTWSECYRGFINTCVNAIASTGDTTIVGTNAGVFLSTDNGSSWQSKNNGLTDYNIASILIDGENLYVGSQSGTLHSGVFLSTDWGANWKSNGLPGTMTHSLLKSDSKVFVGASDALYSSTDNGASWRETIHEPTFGLSKIASYAFSASANGVFVIIDDAGSAEWWFDTNGIPTNPPIIVRRIYALDSDLFISCTEDSYKSLGVFRSSDYGSTWRQVADTLFPLRGYVTCFASFENNLFAATDSDGIFLTTDYGTSWTRENLGLGDSMVVSLAVQGNELLAGTATSGVWRRPLAEMIPSLSVAAGKQIGDTISVYPDPASSIVTVSCPDIVGITEASLISETGATVWHRTITTNSQPFQLDLTSVVNGAYQLELRAGSVSQTTKIVLQR